MRAFASDNYAPILPEALDAIAAANHGHATSYGADEWTARLQTAVRAHFGDDAVAFPVFNGTGANVVGLRSMLRPWQGVICAESAHLNVDECGAPEIMGGIKLLTVPTPDGKLTPELVSRRIVRVGDEHVVQPGVVSVTQSTELGTLYSLDELAALRDHAHAHGMLFHIDGSRLANAAASLGVGLGDVASRRGRRVARRDQGRAAGGRGRDRAQPGAHSLAAVPAQAVDAAGVEDALPVRPAARAARRTTCGGARPAIRTRWRRGWPTACATRCR